MILETGSNTGQYQSTSSDNWTTTGFKFNSKLSKCANCGKVLWDYANKSGQIYEPCQCIKHIKMK